MKFQLQVSIKFLSMYIPTSLNHVQVPQSIFLLKQRSCHHGCFFVSSPEENDHLKAENRSLKKDLLTAIENAASGNKKVPLKGAFFYVANFHIYFVRSENLVVHQDDT